MYDFFWKEDKETRMYDEAQGEMNKFFSDIDSGNDDFSLNGSKLVYRKDQHKFAIDVMKAIRDKELLLIQAGVGIGKSMGYLIPIFSVYNNVESFDNVIISTSNIGLQQQLLTDINNLSKMLGIDIKVVIAKGISNYACMAKIDRLLAKSNVKDKDTLMELRKDIYKKKTVDRDELIRVSDEIWQQLRMNNRGACSRCEYMNTCLHRKLSKDINKASIVITNHDYLAKASLDDRDFVNNADMFVIDEAHNLESSVRNISSGFIELSKIKYIFDYYLDIMNGDDIYNYIEEATESLYSFFDQIKRRGSGYYRSNSMERGIGIVECDKIPFSVGKMEYKLENLINIFNNIIFYVQNYYRRIGYNADFRISYLKEVNKLFGDMLKKDNSKNIYWVNFYKNNRINIGYTCRDVGEVTKGIFYKDVPIVCTSATLLDANGSYDYLKKGLGIDKISPTNKTVVNGKVYFSPYNYDDNSVFYYDKNITDPNNYDIYKEELVDKVSELLKITNGRALVLFTSKSTMDYVYDKIDKSQFDFKIYKQGQESNSQLCKKFEKNVKSCLFGTGAFWEGIDIKGKSLCNVIITRLPFANVDAIMEAKACEYKNDAFKMVYLNDMIQKLTQGTGRLIRGGKDRGIVACLDSRFESYLDIFRSVTDFTNYTCNINDLYDYSSSNITNRDGKRKPYGPRKKQIK